MVDVYQTVVEAAMTARDFYATEGFQTEIAQYTVPLPDRFSHKETQVFAWMVRPAKV